MGTRHLTLKNVRPTGADVVVESSVLGDRVSYLRLTGTDSAHLTEGETRDLIFALAKTLPETGALFEADRDSVVWTAQDPDLDVANLYVYSDDHRGSIAHLTASRDGVYLTREDVARLCRVLSGGEAEEGVKECAEEIPSTTIRTFPAPEGLPAVEDLPLAYAYDVMAYIAGRAAGLQ